MRVVISDVIWYRPSSLYQLTVALPEPRPAPQHNTIWTDTRKGKIARPKPRSRLFFAKQYHGWSSRPL